LKLPFKSDASHDCAWKHRALELEQEFAALCESAAFVDPVTGLGNPVQFMRDATRLAAAHRRNGTPFSVAIVEARYVSRPALPLAPDEVSEVARVLLDASRTEDSVSRLNGFQFGVVLANAHEAGAREFNERVCARLGVVPLAGADGPRYVEVSVGCAEWKTDAETVGEMKAEALVDLQAYHSLVRSQRAQFLPTTS
jgi:GGDEF domain-containing protein